MKIKKAKKYFSQKKLKKQWKKISKTMVKRGKSDFILTLWGSIFTLNFFYLFDFVNVFEIFRGSKSDEELGENLISIEYLKNIKEFKVKINSKYWS